MIEAHYTHHGLRKCRKTTSASQKPHIYQLTWRIGSAPRHRSGNNAASQSIISSSKRRAGQADSNDGDHLPEESAMMSSPSTILKKGSSDPFTVTAEPVDAFVHGLLTFNKVWFEPFIMSMEKGHDHESSLRNKLFQTSTSALYDERTVSANLARLAMIKLSVVDDEITRTAAARFMSKAYGHVIQQASSTTSFCDPNIPVHILSLLSFEVVARNYRAAAVHARILQGLFIEMKLRGHSIDPFLKNSAIYMDMKRSTLSWTRPIILLEQIVPSETLAILPTIVAQVERLGILSFDPPTRFTDTGIPYGNVSKEFAITLLLFRIGATIGSGTSSKFFGQCTVGAWGAACTINFQRMLQLHLSAKEVLRIGTKHSSELKREAAVSLAMFYWVYSFGNFDFIDPSRAIWRKLASIWSPSRRILAELNECTQAIDWYGDPNAPPSLRLWLLYVCTLAEQVLVNIAGEDVGWEREHNKAFAAQAQQLALWSWDDVELVLQRYAYLPGVSVLSKPWFEMCVAKSLAEQSIPHVA